MNIKILKLKQNPKLKTIYQLGMDLSVFDYEFWETISFEYPLIQFPPKLCPFLILYIQNTRIWMFQKTLSLIILPKQHEMYKTNSIVFSESSLVDRWIWSCEQCDKIIVAIF